MVREFSIVREMAAREVARHARRFLGITVTEPRWAMQDGTGAMEWVCDIRVGVREGWAVIKDCLVAQWALGAVTDLNIPVVAERSEAGRVTIIARSEVQLPDIMLDSYTYEELGFGYMRNLEVQADGSVVDGFGYEFAPPGHVTVVTIAGEDEDTAVAQQLDTKDGPKSIFPRFINELIEWGSTDFNFGETLLGARNQYWEGLPADVIRALLPELKDP